MLWFLVSFILSNKMAIINNNYYNLFWQKEYPYLCFTANTASSTVQLNKTGSPTSVTLETSTDWTNWTAYTFWNTITLSNIWDKVYFRNTSTTDTWFSTGTSNYYRFAMTWSISASWDINYLLNKNSTTTLSNYCYCSLFQACSIMTTAPQLLATTLANYCYRDMFFWCTWLTTVPKILATTTALYCCYEMFRWCTNLTSLPKLLSTTLANFCYNYMFQWCSKIKLSTTQTGEYQTEYRIPITWTWTAGTNSLTNMFANTWWTFKPTPSINTTYYTSNTIV